jgi:predicted Zn-dependent protease
MKKLFTLVIVLSLVSCAMSPTGRRQVSIFPDTQMSEMGVAAFNDMKKGATLSKNKRHLAYVQCITDALIEVVPDHLKKEPWEVQVFDDESPNAFALPGGKIGVHTGMFKVASTPDQLASVIGHEIGHVWAKHGNERMSQQYLTKSGMDIATMIAGEPSAEKQLALQLLGAGAQVGIILPFSRTHESEADEIGLDLMAKAGFKPQASVQVWQNMAKLGGKSQAEFLSTHPAHQTRIRDLNKNMAKAEANYQIALQQGKSNPCSPL